MISIDLSDLTTQAGLVVAGLASLIAVIGGLRLGFRVVKWVIQEVGQAF